jgi:succinate dehydrogenase / fumarate reductase cytochrome b subunit
MGTQTAHNYFYIKRLHSLLGIIPIGAFLLEHFFSNSFAFKGGESFNKLVESFQSLPLLPIIEIGFIGLPILFHAVLGLVIFYAGKSNFLDYGYYRNWMYFLQRITGVVALIFIVLHVWEMRLRTAPGGQPISFADMQQIFASPSARWFYIIGILTAAFHLTNGVCTACMTWGITVSRRSQRIAAVAGWCAFAVMGVWGVAIMYAFR